MVDKLTLHFTENDLSLIKVLAESIGIPNLHIEFEGWDNEGDTLIIEHSEYINFYPDNEPYQTGHIVSFPGNYHEPPDADYMDRREYRTFADAAQDCILHIVTENINSILEAESERTCDVSSDLLGSSVSDLAEESPPMYGIVWKDGWLE